MDEGEISTPLDIIWGHLVFKVKEIIEPSPVLIDSIADDIWKEYVEQEKQNIYSSLYKDYFETNIDSFIVPAAYITRIIIDPELIQVSSKVSRSEIQRFYTNNQDMFQKNTGLFSRDEVEEVVINKIITSRKISKIDKIVDEIRDNILKQENLIKIAEDNYLKLTCEQIYLEKIFNTDIYNEIIAEDIKSKVYSFSNKLKHEDKIIIYKVLSYFPEYLPRFSEVESQLHAFVRGLKVESTEEELLAYYNENQSKFYSPDSISIGGAFVSVDTTGITIEDQTVDDYFNNHKEKYLRPESILFDYIFLKDQKVSFSSFAEEIRKYVQDEVNFQLLKHAYHSRNNRFQTNFPMPVEEFPRVFRKHIESSSEGCPEPIYDDNGWYIIKIIKRLPSQYLEFDQVKENIRTELKQNRAIELAQIRAKTVFDSTSYFSHCQNFTDIAIPFEFPLQSIHEPFQYIGDILPYLREFRRLYKREKYHSVVGLKDGYATIFLLDYVKGEKLPFEKAYNSVKIAYEEDKLYENARQFIGSLIQEIKNGENPDSVMFFFGGWKKAENLSLDRQIPGIELSYIIMQDIAKKKQGEFSHVIRLNKEEFLVYKVERKNRVSNRDFKHNKESFYKTVIDKRFKRWFENYRAQSEVEIIIQ